MLRKIVRGLPRSSRRPQPTSFQRVSAKNGEVRPSVSFFPGNSQQTSSSGEVRTIITRLTHIKLDDWSALVNIDIICSRLQRVRSRDEMLRVLN